MKTLILTQHDDGRFEVRGNVTDVIEQVGLIESARIMIRCDFIQHLRKNAPDPEPNSSAGKDAQND